MIAKSRFCDGFGWGENLDAYGPNDGKMGSIIGKYSGAVYSTGAVTAEFSYILKKWITFSAGIGYNHFWKDIYDDYITPFLLSDTPDFGPLAHAIGRVAVFYALGVLCTYLYNRIMVNVTQGTLRDLRNDLFEHMEKLPIRYFDSHAHGDIMSVYTNDIDTLRQMISQSIPQVINSGFTIISVFVSMLILNIPLTIVTLVMP